MLPEEQEDEREGKGRQYVVRQHSIKSRLDTREGGEHCLDFERRGI